MGDKTFDVLSGVKKRLVDMGDGTHAEMVVAVTGTSPVAVNTSPSAPVGNVSIKIAAANVAQALPAKTFAQGGNLRSLSTNADAGAYIGLAGVTAANGFPLFPGEAFPIPAGDTSGWYIISPTVGDEFRLAGA